jgi:hypothetical protein
LGLLDPSVSVNRYICDRSFLLYRSMNQSSGVDVIPDSLQWGAKIEKTSWRVDTRTSSKFEESGGANAVMSLFELSIKKPDDTKQSVRFELTREKMNEMLSSLEKCERELAKLSKE